VLEDKMNDNQIHAQEEDLEPREDQVIAQEPADEKEQSVSEINEVNNKYLRLYAEFENYKKRVNKDKEELVKYGNENLLYELLPVVDNLELALKHASEDISSGLIEGVEITKKELMKILEKFGISTIEAEGKPFDPSVHHAMTQVERDDIDENIVVEEFRKGYMLRDKVLRPALVSVSKKTDQNQIHEDESNQDDQEIKIKIKEES
jgi:molecular chaperone GrpE